MAETVKVYRDGRWESRVILIFTRVNPDHPKRRAPTIDLPVEVLKAWDDAKAACDHADKLMEAWQLEAEKSSPPPPFNPNAN